jgi:diaminohydroxyphosphoribosylaminopyrimidine deaminase/5-amino-6-(5-phosphoribosylamino)uracil reductase
VNDKGEKIRQTITGKEVRCWVGDLRSRCDAVVVGGSTLKIDEPSLNTRFSSEVDFKNEPSVVVFAREINVSDFDSVKSTGLLGERTLFCSGMLIENSLGEYSPSINSLGVNETEAREAWAATVKKMGALGFHEVLVECGPVMLEILLESGLWDEFNVFTGALDFRNRLHHKPLLGRLMEKGRMVEFGMVGKDFCQIWNKRC